LIDHIIYADPDLDRAISTFSETYGIAPLAGGQHLGFGTRNALIGLGNAAYLELMAVDPQQDVPASRRFFGLDAHVRPYIAAWCARAPRPLEETVAIARAAGLELGEIFSMSRTRHDGTTISWRLTSPFATRDGVLPFYIDWGSSPNPGASMPTMLALDSLTAIHPEPDRIRTILGALGEAGVDVAYGPSRASGSRYAESSGTVEVVRDPQHFIGGLHAFRVGFVGALRREDRHHRLDDRNVGFLEHAKGDVRLSIAACG